PWFLERMSLHLSYESELTSKNWPLPKEKLLKIKQAGWTDRAIAFLVSQTEAQVRETRENLGIFGAFQAVDTCAAEFEAKTPYLYSTYRGTDESKTSERKKVMILGGGPNRIGQGIEFDYCCVHAAMA